MTTTLNSFDLAAVAANVAESKKASDVVMLETGKVSYLADYFVICSADSTVQIKAIADAIEHDMEKLGQRPVGLERDKANKWHLLDYGDIVIHIMSRQERQYYQLEQFWNHANLVARESWAQEAKQAS